MDERRRQLLLEVGKTLAPLGFRKREQSFRREVAGCRQSLHLSFIPHRDDFDVTADVAVRHHALEDILNQDRASLTDAAKKDTCTVGAELGNIAGTGQHRWTVVTVRDVGPVVVGVEDLFLTVGLPWLERFSRVEEVHRVLRNGGMEAALLCPIAQTRNRLTLLLESLKTPPSTPPLPSN